MHSMTNVIRQLFVNVLLCCENKASWMVVMLRMVFYTEPTIVVCSSLNSTYAPVVSVSRATTVNGKNNRNYNIGLNMVGNTY